jgi:hypothetical protein
MRSFIISVVQHALLSDHIKEDEMGGNEKDIQNFSCET